MTPHSETLMKHHAQIKKLEEQVYLLRLNMTYKKDIRELENKINEPSNLDKNLSKSFATLHCEVTELKVSLQHVLERLHQLEERERARARDEHERDVSE